MGECKLHFQQCCSQGGCPMAYLSPCLHCNTPSHLPSHTPAHIYSCSQLQEHFLQVPAPTCLPRAARELPEQWPFTQSGHPRPFSQLAQGLDRLQQTVCKKLSLSPGKFLPTAPQCDTWTHTQLPLCLRKAALPCPALKLLLLQNNDTAACTCPSPKQGGR